MFDLPVLTAPQRREATRFRKFLLDRGFSMVQFSVYVLADWRNRYDDDQSD